MNWCLYSEMVLHPYNIQVSQKLYLMHLHHTTAQNVVIHLWKLGWRREESEVLRRVCLRLSCGQIECSLESQGWYFSLLRLFPPFLLHVSKALDGSTTQHCSAQRFNSCSQLPEHICWQLSASDRKVWQCRWDMSCLPFVQTESAACSLYSLWRMSIVQLCYGILLGTVQTCFNSVNKPTETRE